VYIKEIYAVYIYEITNRVNGKTYIGMTIQTLNKRLKEHIGGAFKATGKRKER